MAQTFMGRVAGVIKNLPFLQVSAGASSAGQPVALNSSGLIDTTMLPPSSSGQVQRSDTAAQAISAGQLINFGPSGVRPADSTSGYPADGYSPNAVASGGTGTFNLIGVISGLSGLTKGTDYFLGANGAPILAASLPTAAGTIVQRIGKALSATEINFENDEYSMN